jgi:predicted transcriptional regulator
MVSVLPIDPQLFDQAMAAIKNSHEANYGGSDSVIWVEAYREFARQLEQSQVSFQAAIAQLGNAPGN